ncbi:MAG: hypothetical protein ACO29O_08780, partial [Chitinophagaceae bacterium]
MKRTRMLCLRVFLALLLLPALSRGQTTYSSETTDGNPISKPGLSTHFTITLEDGPVYNPVAKVTLFRWHIVNNQQYGLSHAA